MLMGWRLSVVCFLQVAELQTQDVDLQRLTEDYLTLKNHQEQLEAASVEVQDQVNNEHPMGKSIRFAS